MASVEETQKVVDAYSYAWMSGDIDAAFEYLADDLRFRGSIDSFDRAVDFKVALGGFRKLVTDVNFLDRFYECDRAVLLYDCETTTAAGKVRTAEFFRLEHGRIAEIRLVFDASELRSVMGR